MSRSLQRFDRQVLRAILSLREDAYGVTIHEKTAELAGRKTSPGAVYFALDRLEDKGFIASWLAEATPQRGQRRRRFYRVEALGERALQESIRPSNGILKKLWEELEEKTKVPKWTLDQFE